MNLNVWTCWCFMLHVAVLILITEKVTGTCMLQILVFWSIGMQAWFLSPAFLPVLFPLQPLSKPFLLLLSNQRENVHYSREIQAVSLGWRPLCADCPAAYQTLSLCLHDQSLCRPYFSACTSADVPSHQVNIITVLILTTCWQWGQVLFVHFCGQQGQSQEIAPFCPQGLPENLLFLGVLRCAVNV